jgi:hypothetical protein
MQTPSVELDRVHAVTSDGVAVGYLFVCPGCRTLHYLKGWKFNGSLTLPTFQPSILVRGPVDGARCHSFIENGEIRFLADTTHDLANKSVPLPEYNDDQPSGE